ncbi:MAG: hypothetical protein OXE79_00775 [Acidimicrobiaceae bacterium]|nr:hypothetical protein [Acidimicrobiaceae bacterium]MCY4280636.1 hypothetical protein [Acidimicrobiaceae bacterium]MCY4293411.1 hypothetical protein [Acidimicrobiaceae bacterium]
MTAELHRSKPGWLVSQAPDPPGTKLPRPSAFDGRTTLARAQATLYRHRWFRWAAAGGAAMIVVLSMRGNATDTASTTSVVGDPPGPAGMLPAGTRGVPVAVTGESFAVRSRVDVHAVADGAAVVRDALIVESGDGEVVVAVPDAQVDATVDALFTGGVLLVLVPSAQPGGG